MDATNVGALIDDRSRALFPAIRGYFALTQQPFCLLDVDETTLKLVEMVRPKLRRDGMFMVGFDVVDDKLMKINVFSPGGLGSAVQLTGVDLRDPGDRTESAVQRVLRTERV